MIILDTDHISVLQDNRAAQHALLLSNITASADQDFVTTVVSVEEQMRGWLALVNRSAEVAHHVLPYARLIELVRFYCSWVILPFDERAADQFNQLRSQKVRIGTMDLKIASLALVENVLLLSANLRDYQQVPNLHVEDWLH